MTPMHETARNIFLTELRGHLRNARPLVGMAAAVGLLLYFITPDGHTMANQATERVTKAHQVL